VVEPGKKTKENKMNKAPMLLLLLLTLTLTACSGSVSSAAGPAGNAPGSGAAGELSMPLQVALGTIKLDGTKEAVTAEQAKELLPLWETLQVLTTSDTAATEEKDALVGQIQEAMTKEQTQAITSLGLTRQDMFSILQSRVQTFTGNQNNGNSQNGGASTNRGSSFGSGDRVFVGPPPDGGGFAGGGNFQGQGQGSQSQSGNSANTNNRPAAIDPNSIPTPLIQAVIEYLKTKAGA
jgi:hypothetical protein